LNYDSDESIDTQERRWHEYRKELLGKQDEKRRSEANIENLNAEVLTLEKYESLYSIVQHTDCGQTTEGTC
jgi:hypothetical protein